MNRLQLAILWLMGIAVSAVLCTTGLKLLAHAARTREVLEMGYPFTILAGTAWTYILPTIIIGAILMITLGSRSRRK